MSTVASKRGSEELLEAWRQRAAIDDELVAELAQALQDSPAEVEDVSFSGGDHPSGARLSLAYSGDDIPICGNDLQWLLELLRKRKKVGGEIVVIINGRPALDRVILEAALGSERINPQLEIGEQLGAGLGR